MNLVSKGQWSGWFKGLGSGGVILTNALTVVLSVVMAGLAIFFVLKIIHAATVFANAEGPEQRKEARWKLIWVVAGLICAIIGPALILILMNTVGKTIETQTSGDGSAAQASLSSFRQNISLNIPILDF